jgi:hypothetical protein
MTEAKSPLTMSHDEAVAKLNRVVADIFGAREQCHKTLHAALAELVSRDTLEQTLFEVDRYTATLEAHFNDLLELKLLHPAAWDASEGGRCTRAHQAALGQLVTELVAMVFGARRPDPPQDGQERERASGVPHGIRPRGDTR